MLVSIAQAVTGRLHDGSLTRYAAIFTVTVVAVTAHAWMSGTVSPPSPESKTPTAMMPLQISVRDPF